jgi:hypothetical protein
MRGLLESRSHCRTLAGIFYPFLWQRESKFQSLTEYRAFAGIGNRISTAC